MGDDRRLYVSYWWRHRTTKAKSFYRSGSIRVILKKKADETIQFWTKLLFCRSLISGENEDFPSTHNSSNKWYDRCFDLNGFHFTIKEYFDCDDQAQFIWYKCIELDYTVNICFKKFISNDYFKFSLLHFIHHTLYLLCMFVDIV